MTKLRCLLGIHKFKFKKVITTGNDKIGYDDYDFYECEYCPKTKKKMQVGGWFLTP